MRITRSRSTEKQYQLNNIEGVRHECLGLCSRRHHTNHHMAIDNVLLPQLPVLHHVCIPKALPESAKLFNINGVESATYLHVGSTL